MLFVCFDKISGDELIFKGVIIKLYECKLVIWEWLDVLCNV